MVGCAPRTSPRMGRCGRFTKRKVQARGGYMLIHVFLQETLGSQVVERGVEPISEIPARTVEKARDVCAKDGDDQSVCGNRNHVRPLSLLQPH
jgi:hypothetical protein